MAGSDEINVLSICVELLETVNVNASQRIVTYLNSKFSASEIADQAPSKKRGRPAKKKRGRPRKNIDPLVSPAPKKRGRPKKTKAVVVNQGIKKRGRPRKIKGNSKNIDQPIKSIQASKRGRPRKNIDFIVKASTPAKRGRPPKKRRGRPRKIA